MDVNGARLHLVLGRASWLGDDVDVQPSDAVSYHDADDTLRLTELPFEFPESTVNRRLGVDDRRGADRDAFGTTYWIGEDRRSIRLRRSDDDAAHTFWPQRQPCEDEAVGDFAPKPAPPGSPPQLAGLAVTDSHHLVVGVPGLPGVLVFDLHAGGPPVERRWPEPLWPVDMAAAPGGGVWILERPPAPAAPRLWGLDGALRICNLQGLPVDVPPAVDFRPEVGAAASPALPPPQPPSPAPLAAADPVAIMALPDGTVLLLDRGAGGGASLLRHDGASPLGAALPLEDVGGTVIDAAYLPTGQDEDLAGEVLVADEQGDQAVAYALDGDASSLTRLTRYLPMRLFGGKALVEDGSRVFYDQGERWLPLVDRRRCRYTTHAVVTLTPFDSGTGGTVWHRLALDARIPSRCRVHVRTRAADAVSDLTSAAWQDEPSPYRRGSGSEVGYHRWGADDADDEGTFELLLQRAVGRHLQVRLEITGDGTRSPRLWALRAHEPRFSYLTQYLPDVYGQDEGAADFLTRYLANVEGVLTTVEGRVASAQRLFDVTTAGVAHLPWLASWIGGVIDPAWDEPRTRLFLQHAVELFGRRGTVRGLLELIALGIDPCPDERIFDPTARDPFGVRIVEAFRTRSVPGVVFGDPGDLAGPRVVEVGERWEPADGRAALDQRWRDHVTALHGADVVEAWGRPVRVDAGGEFTESFPPLTPASAAEAADRRAFIDAEMAMTYADVGEGDLSAWRAFLAQRYRRPAVYAGAWRLPDAPTTFGAVALPADRLPDDGPALRDWTTFVSAVLPTRRAAHRFDVLVPTYVGETDAQREDRVAQVTSIVEQERPSHTAFTVTPYWAAFRVGAARVGLETVAGESSRFTAIVLGDGRVAAGRLAGGHPWDVPDRWVVGRERVTSRTTRREDEGS